MTIDNDREILRRYEELASQLNDLTPIDLGVGVFDLEKCLVYIPGKKMNLGAKTGDPVKPGSSVHRAMTEKRRIFVRVGREVYGQAYLGVALPIYNEAREVIGGIAVTEPVDKFDQAREIADKLYDNTSVLASTTEEISAQTEEIASVCQVLAQISQKLKDQVKEMDTILGFIRSIANQTNLLGLNAAIEAARVGDMGRGFGVVAGEIRNLSNRSGESIKQIESLIIGMQGDSDQVYKQMNYVDSVVSEVASAITNVANSVQQVAEMSEKLNKLAVSLESDESV